MEKCLCNRCFRRVIATCRWVPLLSVWVILCWTYYTYVGAFCFGMVESVAIKLIFLNVFHLLMLLFLWSNIQTVFSSIGRPPKLFNFPHQIRAELGAATTEPDSDAIIDRFARERKLPVLTRSSDKAVRSCLKCSCVKPDRTHHCSTCGHCNLKFDHHCPWINSCINFNNYKFFMLFLGYGTLLGFFTFFTLLPSFISFWQNGDLSRTELNRILVLILFFFAGLVGLSMGCFFGYHLFLVSKNQSTIESIRPPVFTYGRDKNGYNLGIRQNFREVFGTDKRKWFLPLFSSLGDGIKYPQKPNQRTEGMGV